MVLIGIVMMGSIQKAKYIVDVDYVNLAKSIICRQSGV